VGSSIDGRGGSAGECLPGRVGTIIIYGLKPKLRQ